MTTRTSTEDARAPSLPEPPGGTAPRRPASWTGLWFVLPFVACYALFLVWPTLTGLGYSLTDQSLSGAPAGFVGLANWQEALADPNVWSSLRNTLVFTALSVPPLVLVGLGMALLTDRARRLGWFLRFAFFAPFVLPVAVVTLIWVWIYQPGIGLINGTLAALGLGEVNWLTDERFAMLSVVATTTWWTAGFNYLLYLAALQGIPREVHEAAALDGAGSWQRLRGVTLPLLRRTTALVLVLQLVASLKVFDQMYLMTIGLPDAATRPIIQYVYESGFTGFRIGYASAVSYLFFAVVIVASIVQFRLFSRKED
ncbi:carbohydrate ABC transporter permease [Actinorugispora endophytica]|uniref:Carbohydrate ABC transporter membrane protein 1 (CUT1 family) n=1 Tax=Actinorugispora endophytica TaxID=1605990 RepID=A0A4R6V0Z5_9ACTN|nr:sugar ABC transporter permease [Actinorugispora endophytica]TDQ52030.1 carbohydrate ABC transporter membrane protein 1 (CUT1 family) [Actinorugispora endophytica]